MPQTYEYRLYVVPRSPESLEPEWLSGLNELAAEGWRVVETLIVSGGPGFIYATHLVLERESRRGE
jgi:hypothetical protein